MDVTKIENVTASKFKVFLDEEFAFVLYKGELSRFGIKENEQLSTEDYEKIKKEIVIKRAKKRILHLLEQMSRSEQQIRIKLKQNYYTEEVIDIAVEYAKSFSYIDDENYARNYAQWKMSQKSRKEIYFGLSAKGIEREIIDNVLEGLYQGCDEEVLIKKLILKKKYDLNNLDRKDLQKLNGYLMRKGFSYGQIRDVLERIACEIDEN